MKIILQHDIRDCGATCLAMIAEYYGLKIPISHCREITGTNRSGTNLYGLVEGAEKIGLAGEGLSGSPDDLLEGIQTGEIPIPFIAHTVSEDGMLHYVVVFGVRKGNFLIGDPAKGKRRLSKEEFFALWTGYVAIFSKTERFQKGNYTRGGFLKFFRLLKGQLGKLTGVLLLSLLVAAIGIAGAFVFQIIMDTMGSADSGGVARWLENRISQSNGLNLTVIFVSLLGLYLLQAGLQFVRGYLIATVSRTLDLRLSLNYYNHLTDLPISSIQVRQTGEYLSRFSDIGSIRQAISGATVTLLLDTVMVLACGWILALENSRLFLLALGMVGIYSVLVFCYRKPVERNNREVMEQNARVQSWFKESVDGMETIKAATAGEQAKKKTADRFRSFVNALFRNALLSVSQDTLAGLVEVAGTVGILWMGFSMVLAGEMTVGALITFYALLAYFTEPVKNLIELQPMLQTAFVAADRLNDVMDLEPEKETEKNPLSPVKEWELRHIDFRYGNRERTLSDVSIQVRRGEKVALVGESGSGKTTLAKLLLRFYEPEGGEILLDGVDIRTKDLTALRREVAYVDQNTYLFSDSIRNNLTLGNPSVSEEEMVWACRVSHAHEFISALPLGYDTPLDENGANLSGGERQRLAIARALLKKPQLLILDEATSNLDTITEAGIKETIFGLQGDMTCLIIAHRLSTIQTCDRIYVMEHGKVAESGTHRELLQRKGRYAELWENNAQ